MEESYIHSNSASPTSNSWERSSQIYEISMLNHQNWVHAEPMKEASWRNSILVLIFKSDLNLSVCMTNTYKKVVLQYFLVPFSLLWKQLGKKSLGRYIKRYYLEQGSGAVQCYVHAQMSFKNNGHLRILAEMFFCQTVSTCFKVTNWRSEKQASVIWIITMFFPTISFSFRAWFWSCLQSWKSRLKLTVLWPSWRHTEVQKRPRDPDPKEHFNIFLMFNTNDIFSTWSFASHLHLIKYESNVYLA